MDQNIKKAIWYGLQLFCLKTCVTIFFSCHRLRASMCKEIGISSRWQQTKALSTITSWILHQAWSRSGTCNQKPSSTRLVCQSVINQTNAKLRWSTNVPFFQMRLHCVRVSSVRTLGHLHTCRWMPMCWPRQSWLISMQMASQKNWCSLSLTFLTLKSTGGSPYISGFIINSVTLIVVCDKHHLVHVLALSIALKWVLWLLLCWW